MLFVGPNDGEMACGEFGPGRMAEPMEIVAAIEQALGDARRRWTGLHALVTAGPTREPLDPVRFLANHSSGKQGYAIADALARAGAETVLVSGPVDLAAPAGVKLMRVTTAREMLAACESVAARRCAGDGGGGGRLAARHRRQQQDQEKHRPRRAADQAGGKSRHSGHPGASTPSGRGW